MARSQARILVSIWDDDEFLNLEPRPQRLYLFLLSQPNLNHAGLLSQTVKRWAKTAKGMTVDDVVDDLTALAEARFIVVDDDTEELLIRTFVKNDGIWKQPKMMLAMRSDASEIVSRSLRQRLRAELERLDRAEMKDGPLETLDGLLSTLTSGVSDTHSDTPSEGYPIPQAKPSVGVSDTPTRAGALASASTTASTTTPATAIAPAKPTRDADEIWDALLAVCNVNPVGITDAARGAYNKAVKDLKAIGNVTPTDIRRRAAIYRGQWPAVSMTPTALVRRWSECDRPPPTAGPPPSRNGQILTAARARAEAAEAAQQPEREALG